MRKMKAQYPAWDITKSLDIIFQEIAESWMEKTGEQGDLMRTPVSGRGPGRSRL
jgi:hypothetical protein